MIKPRTTRWVELRSTHAIINAHRCFGRKTWREEETVRNNEMYTARVGTFSKNLDARRPIQHWGPTNIWRHHIKFSRSGSQNLITTAIQGDNIKTDLQECERVSTGMESSSDVVKTLLNSHYRRRLSSADGQLSHSHGPEKLVRSSSPYNRP